MAVNARGYGRFAPPRPSSATHRWGRIAALITFELLIRYDARFDAASHCAGALSLSDPSVAWTELAELVAELGMEIEAEEAHGIVAGLVCGGNAGEIDEDRISAITGARHLDNQEFERLAATLHRVAGAVSDMLEGGGFDVALPLPDDSASVARRTEALAAWCRGFVLGCLGGEAASLDALPPDVGEALRDIMAIAEAEPGEDDEETQDRALEELVEYVRAGVQLIYEELNPPGS